MPSLDPPGGLIPTTPDELTATWLAAILTRHGFSAAIESIEFRPVDASPLTSEVLRVVPRFQDETTGVTPPLLWKRSLADPDRRALFRDGYAQEVAFYREIAPRVGVSVPRCLAAGYNEDSDAHVLILEEIAGAPGDLAGGVSLEEAEAVLRELAILHAADWAQAADPRPPEDFAHLETFVDSYAAISTPFLTEGVDDRAADRTQRYVRAVTRLFEALSEGPQTLTHGDAHPGNVIFPTTGGRPTLVDWQGCHVDTPMRDVARFLVLGLTTEDRRAHEDELLAWYLGELAARGVSYDMASATRHYYTASLLSWGWAVIFFRLEPFWDRQTRAAMPVLARRAAAAFDDASHLLPDE